MEFRILGPLEVSRDGKPVPVTGRNHPKLLAVLLLETGRVVTVTRLIEALWEYDPPTTARRQVQNTLASLRRQLAGPGAPAIEPAGEGYRIVVPIEAVDAQRFADLARQGREAHKREDLTTASRLFGEALDLWRGEALAGLSGRVVEAAVLRLNETRLATLEDRCEVDIALGRHGLVIGELRELLEHHPYRQRVARLLMTALHHNGRTPEALEVYTDLRSRLSTELGLDPDPELARLHGDILRGELTPPKTTEAQPTTPRPAQLPAGTASFTGRRQHLTTLDKLLDGGRTAAVVSAISGLGGAGKTALAVHWAHQVRDRFGDGQLYLNLRGYDDGPPVTPAEALARFLNALGQPGTAIPADVDEAGAMYRSLLADRNMLILLDNARDAAQVRPLLPGGAGNFALVTSRDRLTSLAALDDAAPIRLDTLEPAESVELLSRLLGASRVRAEPAAVDHLARLCGNLPLALRITAANLAERPSSTIAEFVSELEGPGRLDRLTVDDDPAAAVVHTLELSHAALSPGARRLFAALGLLPGEDFTDNLAHHLATTLNAGGHPAVTELTSAHLVERRHGDRLRFHDLVREYARTRPHPDLDDTTVVSHTIDWYVDNRLTMQVDERDNVMRMFSAWDDHPDTWRLAEILNRFIHFGPDLPGQLDLVRRELRKADHRDDHTARCHLNATLANIHREIGDRVSAIGYARESVRILREHDVHDPLGRSVGNLGLYLGDNGQYTEAVPLLLESYNASVAAGNDGHALIRASALGTIHAAMGDYPEGERWATRALELTEQPDLRFYRQGIIYCLCEQYVDSGRHTEAEPLITTVLNQPETTGAKYHTLALVLRARIHTARGRYDTARTDLTEALSHSSHTDRSGLRQIAECAMAELDLATDRHRQAVDRLLVSHPPGDEQIGRWQRAQADRLLCQAWAHLDEPDRALPHGEAALTTFRSMPHPRWEAETLKALAQAHTAAGDTTTATHCQTTATEILHRIGVPQQP